MHLKSCNKHVSIMLTFLRILKTSQQVPCVSKKPYYEIENILHGHILTWETQLYTYLLKSKQNSYLSFCYVFFQKLFLPKTGEFPYDTV